MLPYYRDRRKGGRVHWRAQNPAETMETDATRSAWLSLIPEFLAGLALAVLAGVTYQGYAVLPARIPTHFGLSGAPDAWGPKSTFYLLAVLGVVLYLALTGAQRISARRKYGSQVTEEGLRRLDAVQRGLLRWMKTELLALFVYCQWGLMQVALGHAAGLSSVAMFGLIGALLATALGFSSWAMWVVTKCRA